MALLKFLKGNYASLSTASITEGQVLICGDTGEMFVDVAADKRVKIGDFVVVSNLTALEALDASTVPTSRLYYVEDGNILARSNGTSWTQINKQKTLAELGGVAKSTYDTKMAALEKADSDNADAIAGVDTRLQAAEEKLKSVATTEGLAELTKTVEGHTAALDTINGTVETAGSMLKIAKDAADSKDAAIQAAQKAADDAQSDVDALASTHATDKTALESAIALKANAADVYDKTAIDGKVDTINESIATKANASAVYTKTDVDGMVDDLEAADLAINNKIGEVTEGKTVVEMIADAQATATYDDTEVRGLIDTNAQNIAKEIEDRAGAVSGLKTELEGQIDTKVEQSVYDAKVAALEAKDTELTGLIGDNTTAINGVSTKVDTLVGTDTGKSVRTIANEELAAQLIPENAAESLNTLQEIAAWIQEHPQSASAMNAAIEALEAKVDTGDQTVSTYVTAAINALSIGDYAKAADLTAAIGRIADLETASGTHATKTELQAVADDLDTYKTNHNGDYDNAAIDAKVKGVQDQIDALGDTYTTDAELTAAMEAEVTRANGAYAAKAATETHIDNTDIHVTTEDKAKWNGAQAAAEATAAANLATARTEITTEISTAKGEAISDAEGKIATAKAEAIADAEGKIATAKGEAIADAEGKVNAAKEDLQGKIDTVSGALNTYKTENNAAVALKANSADVYTKTEVENFLSWGTF